MGCIGRDWLVEDLGLGPNSALGGPSADGHCIVMRGGSMGGTVGARVCRRQGTWVSFVGHGCTLKCFSARVGAGIQSNGSNAYNGFSVVVERHSNFLVHMSVFPIIQECFVKRWSFV